jgi:hypothetical protein
MMKKLLILLSIFIFLIVALPAESANLYWRNCLTGGGDCLDGIDGASLADGDGAFVIRDNSGTYEGYIYRLEETAVAESSPDVIAPDSNAGNKRWRLVNIHATGFTGTKVNSAGGSANVLTLSGTLGIMDGADDIFRGIYLNYTNSNHTAGNVFAINIAGITGDADATESAIYIQEGWDSGILSYSPVHLKGPGDVGKLFLFDTGEADYIAIVPPADVTTAYTLTLPAAEPTGLLRSDAGVMSASDTLSTVTINGGTASTVAVWDGSQNLGSLTSQNMVTTGQIDGRVKVVVATDTVTIDASASNQAVYYINGADSARTFNLPAAVAGLAYCFANALYAKALTVDPAAGDQIILAGVAADAGEYVESTSAAATDKICVLAIDTTYWLVTASTGTWAQDTP